MNKKTKLAAVCAALFLQACSSSSGKDYSVAYGQLNVFWRDFLAISDIHKNAFPVGPNESVYMFGTTAAVSVELPNGAAVTSSQDCIQQAADYSTPVPTLDNNLYNECERLREVAREQVVRPSFTEFLLLAERAVREEGSCIWPGYDRAFDQRVRARGSLARRDDERIFFVKMQCAP